MPPRPPQAPPPAAKKRTTAARILTWMARLAVAALVVVVVALVAGVLLVRDYEKDLPSVAELERGYHPSQVTRVLARDGTLLAELFTERRTIVKIDELPAHVKLAVLAAEDANFYNHEGINYLGIARAFIVNLRAGRTRQGGSTITQQVVKNILLDTQERTYKRKMKEALLARRLEQDICTSCDARQRKDKILELYLNHIYFGHGRYGIEEAARDSFGKSARELTIAEAAMLAGVPAGPETFSPKRNLDKALTRRAFVLSQMHGKGFLNDAQYDAAKDEPVRIAPNQEVESELAAEAVTIAKKTLMELEPERGPRGGFTIHTTIDPRVQAAARKALRDNLHAYDARHALVAPFKAPAVAAKGKAKPKDPPLFEGTPSFKQHDVLTGVVVSTDDVSGTVDVRVGTAIGSFKVADYKRYNPKNLTASQFAEVGARLRVSLLAPVPNVTTQVGEKAALAKVPLRLEMGPESAVVALDVRTRQILALAGNYEAVAGGLDRATQSKRQPGSTFKPIVYSYALHSRRYTPATLVDVTPQIFKNGYRPTNYEGWTSTDPLRLREVLAKSVNVGAVRVLLDVGEANVVDWGKALGIESNLGPTPSLALGAYDLKPLELLGAYATFAAGGTYDEPRLVTRIVDAEGKDVALKEPAPSRRVLEPAEAYLTTSMLQSVVDHGTATGAKVLARPVAGKTGTTNDENHGTKDTWFAGYSTEIAAVVWVGYDDNKPLGAGESGGSTALPAWIALMKAAHENKPRAEFPRPAGIVTVPIDTKTGKRAKEGAEGEILDEVFLEGTEPTDDAEAGDAGVPVPGAGLAPLPGAGLAPADADAGTAP